MSTKAEASLQSNYNPGILCFSFKMKYTITNNLADFLSLNLIWNPEKALKDAKGKLYFLYYCCITLLYYFIVLLSCNNVVNLLVFPVGLMVSKASSGYVEQVILLYLQISWKQNKIVLNQ